MEGLALAENSTVNNIRRCVKDQHKYPQESEHFNLAVMGEMDWLMDYIDENGMEGISGIYEGIFGTRHYADL